MCRWVLDHWLTSEVEKLRTLAADQPLVLLDQENNTDVEDLLSPLSHAALGMYNLRGFWPTRE